MKWVDDKYIVFGLTFRGLLTAAYLVSHKKEAVLVDNDKHKVCDNYCMGIPCLLPNQVSSNSSILIAARGMAIDEIRVQVESMSVKAIVVLDDDCIDEVTREIDDEVFIKCLYRFYMDKEINLDAPVTFNEKLNWLKLHDRNPKYSVMVDKFEVKKYVSNIIGESYIIPTIGVWDSFDDICFDELPNQFVLKCTHDSGSVVVVTDKQRFDKERVEMDYKERLRYNYFFPYREWPYKNVKPRIIVEKYMGKGDKIPLIVYKLLCFDGEPRIAQIIQNDKHQDESIDYVDMNFNLLDMRQNFPNSPYHVTPPSTWEKMKKLAFVLSKGIPFVRVDFYEIEQRVFFSEFTFYSDAGLAKFHPNCWDEVLGSWINLEMAYK